MKTVQIVGAGGIGVFLGWFLARAGWDVNMIETKAAKLAVGRREGIRLNGESGQKVRFEAFDDWTPPEGALVLLCVKTYDNSPVLARISERGLLLPVQNGFDPQLENSTHPFEGIAAFVSECERDRPAARITRPGKLYLGGRRRLRPDEGSALQELASAIQKGGWRDVQIVESIDSYKSSKLMYNAAISPLAAAAGIDNGELLRDPVAQRLFFALLRENYSILRRSGIKLARIGPFHPRVVNIILSIPGVAKTFAHFFRPSLSGTYCSMAADIESGRTEIAAYNGYLQHLSNGADCPINAAVIRMLETMKEKCLKPSHDLLIGLQNSLEMGTSL